VLFLHTGLQSLKIHRAFHRCDLYEPPDQASDTPLDYWRSPVFDADPGPESTNLRTLHFHTSEIDPQALTEILSFPRNLQHFTLTHHNFLDYMQNGIERGVEIAVEALRQQQDSLESLNIQGLRANPAGTSFGTFSPLQILEISLDLLFGEVAREEASLATAGCPGLAFDLEHLLPLPLQQLTVRYRTMNPVTLHRLEALKSLVSNKQTRLPNLREVFLIEERLEDEPLTIAQELKTAVARRSMVVLETLTSNGVDANHEVKDLEADPYSPRLRELVGYLGNKRCRESYERRWGPASDVQLFEF
jgi:hypothetical protein